MRGKNWELTMKQITIKNLAGIQTHGAQMEDPSEWIAKCVAQNAWGKPERWVLHKDELGAEVYDEADVLEEKIEEVQPPIDAVVELVEAAVEAKEAVLDEDGNILEEAIEAKEAVYREISPAQAAITRKLVKLKSEFTVEIEDITEKVAQEKINSESLSYLASTDWYIIREIDSGTPCPEEIKQLRAEARSKIVR